MTVIEWINLTIGIIFLVCYAYQIVYIPISWLKKPDPAPQQAPLHDLAVLICARNEEGVICDLIRSLQAQTYPREHIHIFVLADNCTDGTADAARRAGATVYERSNRTQVGKGYALDALLRHLKTDYPAGFDGYLVFDADNVLQPNYIEEMNRSLSQGNDIITSYRNSKNYGTNWISAGYALWFLRESRYLNAPRDRIGSSCAVSGTGFLFSRKVAEDMDGWPYHLLTEDIEFSIDHIIKGWRVAYCGAAELFDEQPVTFRQSWHQRLRWSRGFLQVIRHYGAGLLKGAFHGSFACADMLMNILPAFFLSGFSVVANLTYGVYGALTGAGMGILLLSLLRVAQSVYLGFFLLGVITVITEHRHIHTDRRRMLRSVLTFPLFMATYLPISFASLVIDPGWKPIVHTVSAASMECGPAHSGKAAIG